MRGRVAFGALSLAVAASCGPGTGPPASAVNAPLNTCPAYPCSGYVQSGAAPTCNGGVCVVAATFSGLVLVVSLSEDSYFAPGETFAIPYEDLFNTPATVDCSSVGAVPCTHLPSYGIVQGAYLVTPQDQSPTALDWNLGNPGVSTALPVHVTYRPLWPPSSGSASTAVDADTLDLPLDPIPAAVVVETSPSSPPGPAQGTSIGYQADLQPALYEATVQPDPPFDAAFPPDVKRVAIATGNQDDVDTLTYDTTALETNGVGRQIPTFALSRVGGLVGWTAYLRDQTTLRRISSLPTLGADTTAVTLPTNHHPADGDALSNAELVIAPPDGQVFPLYKVAAQGGQFTDAPVYPALPATVKVSGAVTDVDGVSAVEADLSFEAQAIYVTGPPAQLNTANFEYTGRASARIDPASGASTYSLTLPPGQYQVVIRPLDATHEVTVVAPATLIQPAAGGPAGPLMVDAPRQVQGLVALTDGRPLVGALVDAIPASCATGSSSLCLPRGAQTTCAADGSFTLGLDPGGYVLRIQPPDGTRFPWVTQSLVVGPTTPLTVAPITVPAPVHAAQQLLDPFGNPVVSAVIRVFQFPASGPAIEVGSAITDATGTYDMYLAPSAQ